MVGVWSLMAVIVDVWSVATQNDLMEVLGVCFKLKFWV